MKNNKIKLAALLLILGSSILLSTTLMPMIQSYFQHKSVESKTTQLFKDALESSLSANQTLNWNALTEFNSDILGWITVDNSTISNAIVQYTDNSYYLTHDVAGNTSRYGSIFMDYRNSSDFTDKNTILYGHNMKDGSMFHELINYKNDVYFYEHPYVTIYCGESTLIYEIFTVYVLDANTETLPVTFDAQNSFTDYIEACQKRSLFTNDLEVSENDSILTLVTCSYETDNARTIVQAKRKV